MIAALKEYQQAAGTGIPVYLNIGKKQGVDVGAYLRVFRPYGGGSDTWVQEASDEYLQTIMGVDIGRKLTPAEKASLPRTILGELVVLTAEDETSTGFVTYSYEDIYPGDDAELE